MANTHKANNSAGATGKKDLASYQDNHLVSRLRTASVGREDAAFLYDGELQKLTTYGEFFENAERMAAVLLSCGLQPGDRVAVQADKSVAVLELYVGTVMAGGIFLPLNTSYTKNEVGYFLQDAAPKVLVCDRAEADELATVAKDIARVLTISKDGTGTLIDAKEHQRAGFPGVMRSKSDLAALLYTSGTTGRSKGAMLSHGALSSNSEILCQHWQFTQKDMLIHALPIYHTHGLFVATNITMMAGAAAIFLRSFDTQAVIDVMPQATALMGVPTFYTRLLQHPDLAETARNMRLFVSGSAPLLPETHDQWQEITGHAILERYGMTETNMNTSNPYDGERKAGTVGFPLPGIDLRICDAASGQVVSAGDIGIIEVRGPNLFSGYWNMPEKTAEEMRNDGFFTTGDLGRIDRDGYLQIMGRGKDLIISGGLNIYPKEVEAAIDAIDGVAESAVVGVPDADFGESVVAVVVPNEGTSIDEQSIKAGLAGQIAKFKQPKAVVMTRQLPRNTMGKVQKNVLRDKYVSLLS